MGLSISKFPLVLCLLLLLSACGRPYSPDSQNTSDAEIVYDRGVVRGEPFTVTFDYVGTGQ